MSNESQLKILRQLQEMKSQVRQRELVAAARIHRQSEERTRLSKNQLSLLVEVLDNLANHRSFAFDRLQIAARQIYQLDQEFIHHANIQEGADMARRLAESRYSTSINKLEIIDKLERQTRRKAMLRKEEKFHRSHISRLAAERMSKEK